MDQLYALAAGFTVALTPENLLYALIGVTIGQIIGILPGLGPVTGLALLVPLTFSMDPASGLIMLAGVYYGSMFGGAITSILLNTPGDAAAVVTTFDGYPLAKAGEPGRALGVAAVSSFMGGAFSLVALVLVLPLVARVALAFGPAEYTILILASFTMILGLTGASKLKALLSTLVGLALATVGQDIISGAPRFTFGGFELLTGIDFAVVAIGLFAVGEILVRLNETADDAGTQVPPTRALVTRSDMKRISRPVFEGSVIGFLVGLLPGAGATIAAFLSYAYCKKTSPNRLEFGKGAVEGIAAPEAANNASVGGAMVPMLALGIPGSGSTAVLLGAMLVLGINPGPLFLVEHADIAWGIIASMFVGNIMLLVMNIPMIQLFSSMLRLPYAYIAVVVLVFSVLGAFGNANSFFDVQLMLLFGVVGYVMKRCDFPFAPLILALVLGNLLESNWRRALITSQGDYDVFWSSTVCQSVIAGTLIVLLGPLLMNRVRMVRAPS